MAQSLVVASRTGTRLVTSSPRYSACTIPIFLAPKLAVRRLPTTPHVRHASSSTKQPVSARSHADSASIEALNPPASTRPPVLSTPTRQPEQSAPSYYFALGKSYIAFYKSGLKAVWANYKTSRSIRTTRLGNGKITPDEALKMGQITRGEWHLLRRSAADIRKIPLFGLVLCVFGEFTPLVVLALSGVVPSTCQIPRQVQKEREKLETRRRESFRNGDSVINIQELDAGRTLLETKTLRAMVKELRWEQVLHISRALGLYAKLWDTLWDYPPQWILRRRVQKSLEYIQLDDDAIAKSGGIARLQPEELRIAAEERGLDTLGRSDAQLNDTLSKWLQAKKKQSVPYLILTRPNVWKT